jgi:putative spermidine/putrescine transport system permease protein
MTTRVTAPVLYALGTLTTAFPFVVILGAPMAMRVLARKTKT